jgi:hypothetical protein
LPNIVRWSGFTANAQAQGFNQGDPLRLTWGIVADGTPINDQQFGGSANAPSNLRARLDLIYGSQATWQPLFQSVFDRWSSISGLSYSFEAADDGQELVVFDGVLGTRPDIRIGGKAIDGNNNILAYNYFPDSGDMVIDTNDNFYLNTANGSLGFRNVVYHEHGHGLGMNHIESNNSNFLMEPFLNTAFTGPQYHDVLSAQWAYGDANEKSNAGLGNDISSRATSLGTVGLGGTVSIGNDARNLPVAVNEVDFFSIDSSTDTDFYSFTVTDAGLVTVNLEALGVAYNIGVEGSGGATINFNTSQRSDLRFDLLATDGSTVLTSLNATGLGGNELLSNFNLNASGTYFLRINGTNNADTISLDTQFYGLSVSFAAVPEPSSILLFTVGLCAGCLRRRRDKASD